MANEPIAILLGGCLSLALGGCAAAVIPVAAGGLIGRSGLHGHRRDALAPVTGVRAADTRTAAPARSGAAASAIPPAPAPAPVPAPVPADPSAMQAGTAYAGALPVPGANGRPALPPAVVPPEEQAVAARWSDVLHYVAVASEQRPDAGTLPARARTAADRRWIACGAKPSAVVVDLDATTVADAPTYLRSIETLGLAIVYTSRRPAAVVQRQAAALRRDGLEAPIAGRKLFATPVDPAARYCVLSIVGTAPRDFPGTGAPNPHRGWFLIRSE